MDDAVRDERPAAAQPAAAGAQEAALSKNARKRALRQQRLVATRDEWKARIKEKKRKGREARRGAAAPSDGEHVQRAERAAQEAPAGEVVIDLAFEALMSAKELASLASQICRSYALNRRSSRPYSLVVAGLAGAIKERLLVSFPHHERWQIDLRPEPLEHYRTARRVVYLCADAEETLTEIDDDTAYVIGGIVDRNRHKHAAAGRADALGVATARLPLAEHIKLKSSPVLTVVHVFEILCRYRELGRSWPDAIRSVIPERKQDSQ